MGQAYAPSALRPPTILTSNQRLAISSRLTRRLRPLRPTRCVFRRGRWTRQWLTGPSQIDVSVNAPEAGTIKEFLVNEGDTVTVGQDLVKLEPGSGGSGGDKQAKEEPKEPAKKEQETSSQPEGQQEKEAPKEKKEESKPAPKEEKPAPKKEESKPAPAPKKEEAPKQPEGQQEKAVPGNREERRVRAKS